MTDETEADATAIWDRRYAAGEHVGTRPSCPGDPIDYTQHKFLYRHAIAKPTTGSEDGWVVDDIARRFFDPPVARMLAIGVGMAFIEEHLAATGRALAIVAYELSATAVAAARARVAGQPYAARLDLRQGDVLEAGLPDGGFDAVFVQAAIHHFDRIEEMFALMHRVLRPGGLLVYDEYVGPDHHMYEPEVMAVLDALNDCLAPNYRWDVLAGRERLAVPPPSLEGLLAHDPSEGVHASRILPLTYQYFDVIHRADFGGAVMRPFFTGILPNFDWDDPKDRTVARLIVLLEQLLTRHGAIPHYHTAIVARRRETPLTALTDEEARRINYSDWPGLALATPPAPAPGLGRRLLRAARALVRARAP